MEPLAKSESMLAGDVAREGDTKYILNVEGPRPDEQFANLVHISGVSGCAAQHR